MQKKSNFFQLFVKTFLFCLILASLSLIAFYGWQFYGKAYQENVVVKKTKDVGVKEAVEINFSVPVWNADYAKGIKIIPDEKVTFDFDEAKRKLTITPRTFWQPTVSYVISLPEGRTTMLTKILDRKLAFSVAGLPEIGSVFPVDGATDVVLGAEDPIMVNFNRSVENYYIKFVLNPGNGLDYQLNPQKTQFKILPKSNIENGIKYTLKIFAKVTEDGDENYKQIYDGVFETLKPTPVVWEKDHALRIDQAKKYTKAKITEGKYIDVNLATQIMTTFESGTLLDAFLISSGKRGMETPVGTHQIYNKTPRAYSKAYGLYMPNWMAIVPGGKFGIHELPEWPGGYKEGANHLGIPVSHGCMRLGVGPAKIVYDWAEVGTPVIVY
ncbi:MAG: L,D-transpeptidase family protein [Parcubacteria group bacterium]|jgi:lipoprotein-anchoring transpeptidase ErfK/SrfK